MAYLSSPNYRCNKGHIIWPRGTSTLRPEHEVRIICSAVVKKSEVQQLHDWKIADNGRGLGVGCVEGG